MPTFSAVKVAPYPNDTPFALVPTLDDSHAPDYGFHFRRRLNDSDHRAFDNCEFYGQFYGDGVIYSRDHLRLRYELLFKHKAVSHLMSEYYIVPWILLPSRFSSETTIDLLVSPLSVYDSTTASGTKKALKDKIGSSARVITLVSQTDPTIQAFWGTSGTRTTKDESDLKTDTRVRIVIPSGEYHGIKLIQIQADDAVLGKARISFYDMLDQTICFMKIDPLSGNKYKAKLINPTDIPKSFENNTRLDLDANTALKPYGINVEAIKDAVFRDAANNVLISTLTDFEFDATLKPSDELSFNDKGVHVDTEIEENLLSKIARFTYNANGTLKDENFHRMCVVILLPFHFDSSEPGYTPKIHLDDGLLVSCLRSYILPGGKYWEEHYEKIKRATWAGPNVGNITIIPVANPYFSSTLVHELGHALLLEHTFVDEDKTIESLLNDYRDYLNEVGLSEFGTVVGSPGTIPILFDLIRDMDLKTAVVDEYLINRFGLPAEEVTAPRARGLLVMAKVNGVVFFEKYKTKNIMDYHLEEVTGFGSRGLGNDLIVDVKWTGSGDEVLFKYQWEMIRATVAFLASY